MKRSPIKRGTKQMARGSFKRKTYDEVVSVPRKTKKPVARRIGTSKAAIRRGFKSPKWFNAIPYGSHGSNPTQKRFWKLTSDIVRISDFHKYGGSCVSCSTQFSTYQEGHAGHFKAYGACNSYFKFNRKNIALQCPHCNHIDDGQIGYRFGNELKKRHGDDILDWIMQEDGRHIGMKMENFEIVPMVEKLISLVDGLPEQPDYWRELKSRYGELPTT